jgi:hypothetical protein
MVGLIWIGLDNGTMNERVESKDWHHIPSPLPPPPLQCKPILFRRFTFRRRLYITLLESQELQHVTQ